MRLKTIQIVAGLGAAIAFLLAFMAAGAMLASLLFAVIGAALLAWIVYGVARAVLGRRPTVEALSDDGTRAVGPPAA
jgi:ABC-type Fe3+-siderophore transport system permease subunit